MRKYLVIAFGFIVLNSSLAQHFDFKNYTIADGLPQSTVYTIFQDTKGYIWLGTQGGTSKFNGIEELRHKESDRLKAMQIGLDSMKIKNFFDGETFCIEGRGKDYRPVGFKAQTFFDHRIAMSFAVAGINSESFIEIDSPECINTSFPEFINLGKQLGCNFETS